MGRCEPSECADASEQSAQHPAAPARARAQAMCRRHASPTVALMGSIITSPQAVGTHVSVRSSTLRDDGAVVVIARLTISQKDVFPKVCLYSTCLHST